MTRQRIPGKPGIPWRGLFFIFLAVGVVYGVTWGVLICLENDYVGRGYVANAFVVLEQTINKSVVFPLIIGVLAGVYAKLIERLPSRADSQRDESRLYTSSFIVLIALAFVYLLDWRARALENAIRAGPLLTTGVSFGIASLVLLPVLIPLVAAVASLMTAATPSLFTAAARVGRFATVGSAGLLFCVLALNLVVPSAFIAPGTGRPNVIIVTVDSLRADHVGAYGYGKNTTPFLDAFMANATVYTNAVTPEPLTGPAHASLLTGLHPLQHQAARNGWVVDAQKVTLAEALLEQGYLTQAFVSVFHLDTHLGFGQGFLGFSGVDRLQSEQSSARVTDKTLAWMRTAREPFLLWVHYWDPHHPYAPEERFDVFADPDYEGPIDWHDTVEGRIDPALSPEDHGRITSLYDGEIRYTDAQIERLFFALESRGMLDDALVIVAADHGEVMDEILDSHDYGFDHGYYLYEGNLRIPLTIRYPDGRGGGTRDHRLASILDVMPTILDVVGVSIPENLGGLSLAGRDAQRFADRSLIALSHFGVDKDAQERPPHTFHDYAVRTPTLKYIHDDEGPGIELYNLTADPNETLNLFPKDRVISGERASTLRRFRETHGDIDVQTISPDQREMLESLGYVN